MRNQTANSSDDDAALILDYQTNGASRTPHQEDLLEREILRRFKPLCHYCVHAAAGQAQRWTILTAEDLHIEAQLALLQSAKRYSPDHGATFKTFAKIRIKGAIQDAIRIKDAHIFEQPRYFNEIAAAWAKYSDVASGEPEKSLHRLKAAFITAYMEENPNFSEDYIEDAIASSERSHVGLLTAEDVFEGASHGIPEASLVADLSSDPALIFEKKQAHEYALTFIIEELQKLEPRTGAVMVERLCGDLTSEYMAEALGVTPSRISQMVAKAAAKLHKAFLMSATHTPGGFEISCDDLMFIDADNQSFVNRLQALKFKG